MGARGHVMLKSTTSPLSAFCLIKSTETVGGRNKKAQFQQSRYSHNLDSNLYPRYPGILSHLGKYLFYTQPMQTKLQSFKCSYNDVHL